MILFSIRISPMFVGIWYCFMEYFLRYQYYFSVMTSALLFEKVTLITKMADSLVTPPAQGNTRLSIDDFKQWNTHISEQVKYGFFYINRFIIIFSRPITLHISELVINRHIFRWFPFELYSVLAFHTSVLSWIMHVSWFLKNWLPCVLKLLVELVKIVVVVMDVKQSWFVSLLLKLVVLSYHCRMWLLGQVGHPLMTHECIGIPTL